MQDVFNAQGEPSPADLSPELTKHFRGLRMWLPLKLYGTDQDGVVIYKLKQRNTVPEPPQL